MKQGKCSSLLRKLQLLGVCTLALLQASSQSITDSGLIVTLKAGPQYSRSSLHERLWGKHYRREWNTPVAVPQVRLDTIAGGLFPYQAGGGRQTNSLRLRNREGKEYVLRSIDKTYTRALPDIYRNTFIENILNDQVSTAHPYAALAIPKMAEAAGILHTYPSVVYLPQQPLLDSFSLFSNKLYLFEQRPDENWEEAPNFGYSKDIISTSTLLERIFKDPTHRVDQLTYIRARLFDMFIGDWGRHEDQWRWASMQRNGITTYAAIPRDRDQAFTKYDGTFMTFALSAAQLGHLESFDHKIKNIETFNYSARFLDRQMANETTIQQWTFIAEELKTLLTDAIIEKAVRDLPKEVFPLSGEAIIAKLKSRRNDIVRYAQEYYKFLADEVDITGTRMQDHFEITESEDGKTTVRVFQINNGVRTSHPYYSRTFSSNETDEIRVYGLEGEDSYEVKGTSNKIKLRVVGGPSNDAYRFEGSVKADIYDNPSNEVPNANGVRRHLSDDPRVNLYRYDAFKYNDRGFKPQIFYGNDDRLFVGIGYKIEKQRWRKEPFGYSHLLSARYSITQLAANIVYQGIVTDFIGKWDLAVDADYDLIKWTNFFGIGNERPMVFNNNTFYRMRTRDFTGRLGLNRRIGNRSMIGVSGAYQNVRILNDPERFLSKSFPPFGDDIYNPQSFAIAAVDFRSTRVDNNIIPRKGYVFTSSIAHVQNLTQKNKEFNRYDGRLDIYFPLLKNLVLASRIGGGAAIGEPEFYQLPSIGGSMTLRGFRKDRFYGKTAFYNTNELQYLFNVKSNIFNGTFGLIGLFDDGRVWQPLERSDKWHTGYGGGFMLAPFNRANFSVTYAISDELARLHLRYVKAL
jgi:hypothetical protein